MEASFDELVDGYIQDGIGISSGFLTADLCAALQDNLIRLQAEGRMRTAGIGNSNLKDPTQQHRGDTICWLESDTQDPAEQAFLSRVAAFTTQLNRTCFTGINAWEFHYACYEPGSLYKRHRDQFRNNDQRKFSLISYLNKDWLDDEGGQLCIHPEGEPSSQIAPEAGRAVFFKSEVMAHEVLPASRIRMSVTGWLKRV